MIIRFGALGAIGHSLHRKAEFAQIIARDMQNHIAVMEVSGILATVA
jgi:hypothetical protein